MLSFFVSALLRLLGGLVSSLSALFGPLSSGVPSFGGVVSGVSVGGCAAGSGPACVFSRLSSRSFSGAVAVVCFPSRAGAASFSALIGPLLPSACRGARVRAVSSASVASVVPAGVSVPGGLWGVSVPCVPPPVPSFVGPVVLGFLPSPAAAPPRVAALGGSRGLVGSSVAASVAAVSGCLVRSGASLVVGCCVGPDAAVLRWAVAAGAVASVRCFAAFGSGGVGACRWSAVAAVAAFAAAGGSVVWWAGGGPSVPVWGRLAARSSAVVGAASVGAVFWVASGSRGSLRSARLASGRGLPVSGFACGGSPLPSLAPGGVWAPSALSGPWVGSFSWGPSPALF